MVCASCGYRSSCFNIKCVRDSQVLYNIFEVKLAFITHFFENQIYNFIIYNWSLLMINIYDGKNEFYRKNKYVTLYIFSNQFLWLIKVQHFNVMII